MRAYRKEIIENTVCYIAQTYFEKTQNYPYQMIVYKLLALLDFNSIKTKGRPCTELHYRALPMGPVPDELYNQDESQFTKYKTKENFVNGKKTKQYIPVGKADTDYLCPSELDFLNSKIDYFIKNNFTSSNASDYSHEQIKAWEKTRKLYPNGLINYHLEFDKNIYKKDYDKLTFEEEMFLLYNECQ